MTAMGIGGSVDEKSAQHRAAPAAVTAPSPAVRARYIQPDGAMTVGINPSSTEQ
jgi:hypothetical protein